MTLMQRGNKVTVRSDGTRSSRPFTDEEVSKMSAPKTTPRARVMGEGNKANKPVLDAMKKGGSVRGYGMARKPMKKGGVCR